MRTETGQLPEQARSVSTSEGLARFLLVIGTILFAWALVELPALINIVDYQALEFSGVWGNIRFIRVADPELTHLEPPHAHYAGAAAGGDFEGLYQVPKANQTLFKWDLTYDRNGFRNSPDLEKADTVVIGDSMVEGMTVTNSQVVTSVLQRLQGKVFANMGQYGYGPQQELAVLRRYGLPLQPRTVIWMFFEGNDLTDAISYRQIAAHPPNFWNFFLQRSFTRVAARTVKHLFAPPKPAGAIRSGIMQAADGNERTIYFTDVAGPLSPENLDAIGETTRIIRSANEMSAKQSARFIFVFIPDKFRVLHEFCQFPAESECRRWVANDLPQKMQTALASVSPAIGFLDLTADLVNAAKGGVIPYYPDDIHWSPDGHRIAATSIDDYLRRTLQ